MKDSSTVRMTDGSLWKNIFIFSIPLMCSNLLQVLFNMSDIAVVGQFAGKEAPARSAPAQRLSLSSPVC